MALEFSSHYIPITIARFNAGGLSGSAGDDQFEYDKELIFFRRGFNHLSIARLNSLAKSILKHRRESLALKDYVKIGAVGLRFKLNKILRA